MGMQMSQEYPFLPSFQITSFRGRCNSEEGNLHEIMGPPTKLEELLPAGAGGGAGISCTSTVLLRAAMEPRKMFFCRLLLTPPKSFSKSHDMLGSMPMGSPGFLEFCPQNLPPPWACKFPPPMLILLKAGNYLHEAPPEPSQTASKTEMSRA